MSVEKQDGYKSKGEWDAAEAFNKRDEGSAEGEGLEENEHFRELVQKASLLYLKNEDSEWFHNEYSGDVAPSGYLIGKDGKETNFLPSQCVGSKLGEMETRAKGFLLGEMVQKSCLDYLKTQDSEWFHREYSGDVAPSGYLIGHDGKETNFLPSQCVGSKIAEIEAKTREEFSKLFPEDANISRELPTLEVPSETVVQASAEQTNDHSATETDAETEPEPEAHVTPETRGEDAKATVAVEQVSHEPAAEPEIKPEATDDNSKEEEIDLDSLDRNDFDQSEIYRKERSRRGLQPMGELDVNINHAEYLAGTGDPSGKRLLEQALQRKKDYLNGIHRPEL